MSEGNKMIRLRLSFIPIAICLVIAIIVLCARADNSEIPTNTKNDNYQKYRDEIYAEYQQHVERIKQKWETYKASTRDEWIKYSADLNTISTVNFLDGTLVMETIISRSDSAALKHAAENIFSQLKDIISIDSTSQDTVLSGQFIIPPSKIVDTSNVDEFFKETILPTIHMSDKGHNTDSNVIYTTDTIKMIPQHTQARAKKYLPLIQKYANLYGLDVSLVLAIIQTESYFNPLAKTPAPAFGLMQIVPDAGGLDGYRFAFKEDKIVSPDFLYNPENNIQLGCAFLAKLQFQDFKTVQDDEKRFLCVLASYNIGLGNLGIILSGSRNSNGIIDAINNLELNEIKAIIAKKGIGREVLEYINKIVERRLQFTKWLKDLDNQ